MIARLITILIVSVTFVSLAVGQSYSTSPVEPVRLRSMVGPDTLDTGTIGHFRTRTAESSVRPINYLWDLGDGTLSMGGPLVSVVYSTPGTYTVEVVAQNRAGRDTLQARVQVRPAPEQADSLQVESASSNAESSPSQVNSVDVSEKKRRPLRPVVTVPRKTLYGSGGIAPVNGGYTWVLKTDLWPERARNQMLYYRLQGFRADVYVDTTGRGSPAHRVVVGQFATTGDALAARPWLPTDDETRAWLLELAPEPETASVKP